MSFLFVNIIMCVSLLLHNYVVFFWGGEPNERATESEKAFCGLLLSPLASGGGGSSSGVILLLRSTQPENVGD